MQVTLTPIDWRQLTSFGSAQAFFEWFNELEDQAELRSLHCYDHGWLSDSAMQYFDVARVLQHLSVIGGPELAAQLRQGIQRLLTETGHVDEFAMAPASENCYWISASPATVVNIKTHLDALDLERCVTLLSRQPAPEADEIMADLEGRFSSFITQHARIVDLAVANGYGLIGHCG